MRRHGSTTHWWSPGCDLPHAMLPNRSWKGLYLTINQLLSPRLTSSKLGWIPVKQLPAQHGLARGQVPWLARVASGSTSPCTQKHTNTHNCSKPAGLVSGRPPSPGDRSVTCLTCASVLLTRSQHGKCVLLWTGAAGQACFVKFYFSRNCAFRCFPAAFNRHDKELVELQVEKCEVIPSLKKI